MSTEIVVYQDEATRWGPDPHQAMIAAYKARKRRYEDAAREAQAQIEREAKEREKKLRRAHAILRIADVAERAREPKPEPEPTAPPPAPEPEPAPALKPLSEIVGVASRIINTVATAYGVSREKIAGDRRYYPLVDARHIAFYELFRILGWPKNKIAVHLCHDHTTVMYAIARVKRLAEIDETFRARLMAIEEQLPKPSHEVAEPESL